MATMTLNPVPTVKRDLWAEAAATLSDKEKKLLTADISSKGSISSSVLQMAEQKKAESDKKLWSSRSMGRKSLSETCFNTLSTGLRSLSRRQNLWLVWMSAGTQQSPGVQLNSSSM
jgi:hypothetical protein